MPLSLQQSPYDFPWRPHGHGFAGSNGGIDGIARVPRATRCSTKEKREVASKPFSHRRPLKNVFNDSLGSRAPIASGHHVSDFPNRIARAIVLT